MRPSSARGSEAASVEDAPLATRELGMSCLKVVSLDAQQPFCQEVNERRSFKLLIDKLHIKNKSARIVYYKMYNMLNNYGQFNAVFNIHFIMWSIA